MKRGTLIILLMLFTYGFSFAQLAGSKNIPGDYSSIAAAIADLNVSGVGTGGVTFNIAAGHAETFATAISGLITATGTSSDPVIFQKAGQGANPIITAPVGQGSYDYIICVAGGDYITFDGIDIRESPANSGSGLMEYGFAILKASAANGVQNLTIRNSVITLGNNPGNWGIFSQNWDYTAMGSSVTLTSASGTNSYNKFYNLTFNNCYDGILLYGFNATSPFNFYDQGNEAGKDGSITINGLGWGGAGPENAIVNASGVVAWYQNALTVANCSITGPVEPGFKNNSSFFNGIYLGTGTNSSYDIYSNTISVNYTAQGGFQAIYSAMGKTGTGNSVNVYNNFVINNNAPTVGNTNVDGIALFTGATTLNIYGNVIDNNAFGAGVDTATGGSNLNYIYWENAPTTQGTVSIYGNTITNNTRRLGPLANGGNTNIIRNGSAGGNTTVSIYDNIIENIHVGTGFPVYGVTVISNSATHNVYNNRISNIHHSWGNIWAMQEANATNANWYGNKCQDISHSAATATSIYGFNSTSGGTNLYFYNNFIGDIYSPLSTGTVYGINLSSWPKIGMYNNTIYLNNTPTGTGNASTFGIMAATSDIGNLELRNNLVINNSTPKGTGSVVAFRRDGTSTTSYAGTSNNNCFYAGTPSSGNLIYFDGTNSDQTLQSFKNRVWPRDISSVTELPPFMNIATRPYDLHLSTTVSTQCESGGKTVSTPVSITRDYDNDTRFPNAGYPDNKTTPATAPDMGADEFGGLILDLTAPEIVFTPLLNTSVTGDRTLTTTISDPGGVPQAGLSLPVLYWKINSGSWSSATATWVGGSTYTFTFGAGAVLGDNIYYYIVAEDQVAGAANVGSNPMIGAAGFTAKPPACATPPTTPVSYTIVGTLSGLYTVGAGKDYATLTAAVADLNQKEVVGPVTFELWDATYSGSETFPITINNYLGVSPLNTVTIRPAAGVVSNVSGSSSSGILRLNGCQYVTIDGSNSGGTDRSLTFSNSSTASNTYAIGLLNNGSQGASNCAIRNCNLKASSQLTNNTYGVFLSTTGGGYNNILIDNNSIYSARYGIQFAGNSASKALNGQITNNLIGTATTSTEIKYIGIYVTQADNTLIQGNEIMGPAAGNSNVQQAGIWLFSGATNTKIHKNSIHDFYYNGTAGNGAFGIYFNTSSASTVTEITNNLIYNLKADGNTSTSSNQFKTPAGIQVNNGGNAKIYFNTISLSGNCLSSSRASISSCISICSGASGTFDIRNNILKNSMQPVSGSANFTYGIFTAKTASAFSNLDFNDYFIDGINPNVGYLTTNQAALTDWQTATGMEAQGKNLNPLFISATDLHPQQPLLVAGTPLTDYPLDYSGIIRAATPTIGAFELPQVNTSTASDITSTGAVLHGTVNGCSQVVATSFEYGTTASYGNTVSATPSTVSGTTTTPVAATITGLGSGTLVYYRAVGVAGSATYTGTGMTFTTLSEPLAVTATVTDVSGCYSNVNGAITANVTGGTAPYGYNWSNGATTSSISGIGAGNYSVTITDATSATATGNWTVNQPSEIILSAQITATSCPTSNNGAIDLTAAGGTPAYTYSWNNGSTTQDLTGLAAGDYTVTVTDANNCTKTGSWTIVQTNPVCDNITVAGTVTTTFCYNALNTITVAGDPLAFTVAAPDGHATLIAGTSIFFLPGTHVEEGAYLLARISTDFCPGLTAPVIAGTIGQDEPKLNVNFAGFSLYPNPVSGNFTLVKRGNKNYTDIQVEVFSMNGCKILAENMIGAKQEFPFTGVPKGIYLVKVIADGYVETIKLVKL